jgi:hypothetical protein
MMSGIVVGSGGFTMSEYIMNTAEELILSQRKVIDSLRLAIELKDLLIETLKKKLEEKEKVK